MFLVIKEHLIILLVKIKGANPEEDNEEEEEEEEDEEGWVKSKNS